MVIPDVIQRLAKDYNQVIQMFAPHTKLDRVRCLLLVPRSFTRELIVTFYIRADDRQVVLALCRSTGDSASLEHCCLPLTSMIIRRPESSPCLQLCRRSSSGLELWANLKFSIIESIITKLRIKITLGWHIWWRIGPIFLHVPCSSRTRQW